MPSEENKISETESPSCASCGDESCCQACSEETECPESALEAEVRDTRERYLRILAEYENYRKRTQRERETLYGEITAATATEFLPVLDNLERAAAQPTQDQAYKKGVEMTLAQMVEALGRLGIKEIDALGQNFDPSRHNAVMHIEDETIDDNTVVEVFQKGFAMGDRLIRFAMVKVAN